MTVYNAYQILKIIKSNKSSFKNVSLRNRHNYKQLCYFCQVLGENKTGNDAAQVSIAEDIPLLSGRNRYCPRRRMRRRGWRTSHQHHHGRIHRVRVTDAPLLRCEPACVKKLHVVAYPPPYTLLEKQKTIHV